MTSLAVMWWEAFHWTYDHELDPALFAWRYRWFEPEGNPFR